MVKTHQGWKGESRELNNIMIENDNIWKSTLSCFSTIEALHFDILFGIRQTKSLLLLDPDVIGSNCYMSAYQQNLLGTLIYLQCYNFPITEITFYTLVQCSADENRLDMLLFFTNYQFRSPEEKILKIQSPPILDNVLLSQHTTILKYLLRKYNYTNNMNAFYNSTVTLNYIFTHERYLNIIQMIIPAVTNITSIDQLKPCIEHNQYQILNYLLKHVILPDTIDQTLKNKHVHQLLLTAAKFSNLGIFQLLEEKLLLVVEGSKATKNSHEWIANSTIAVANDLYCKCYKEAFTNNNIKILKYIQEKFPKLQIDNESLDEALKNGCFESISQFTTKISFSEKQLQYSILSNNSKLINYVFSRAQSNLQVTMDHIKAAIKVGSDTSFLCLFNYMRNRYQFNIDISKKIIEEMIRKKMLQSLLYLEEKSKENYFNFHILQLIVQEMRDIEFLKTILTSNQIRPKIRLENSNVTDLINSIYAISKQDDDNAKECLSILCEFQ